MNDSVKACDISTHKSLSAFACVDFAIVSVDVAPETA